MHLYEEYKEYETMWDDSLIENKTILNEQSILQELTVEAALLFPGIAGLIAGIGTVMGKAMTLTAMLGFIAGCVGVLALPFLGGSLAVIGMHALIVVISLLLAVIGTLLTTIFEDVSDEADLEQLIANVNILQKAQTNPKVQKQVQALYVEFGSENAQIIIATLEQLLHKNAKSLAKMLKGVTAKELEEKEDQIVKDALVSAQQVVTKATTDSKSKP